MAIYLTNFEVRLDRDPLFDGGRLVTYGTRHQATARIELAIDVGDVARVRAWLEESERIGLRLPPSDRCVADEDCCRHWDIGKACLEEQRRKGGWR